jgi:hypothetical protein
MRVAILLACAAAIRGGGGLTDDTSHPPPSSLTLPAAGRTYVDPVFHTTILRVTDERDGAHCVHAYSYWPAMNADDTRLLIECDGVARLYRFDAAKLRATYDRPLLGDKDPRLQFEGATWSHDEPDVLYALDRAGRRLYRVDVASGKFTMLRDLAPPDGGRLAQLTVSDDAQRFVATVRGPKDRRALLWDRRTDTIRMSAPSTDFDEAKIDKRGRVVMINRNDGSFTIWDLASDTTDDFSHHVEADAAGGHQDLGARFLASGDAFHPGVALRTWTGLHRHDDLLSYHRAGDKPALNWTIAEHVSLRADSEKFVVVSTYGGDGTWAPFEREIVLAFTDGSGFVRLAHTRSDGASADPAWRYAAQPRATVDRRGRYVVYTSDLGSPDRTDVMLLVIPRRYW